jgi:hypothetical protein
VVRLPFEDMQRFVDQLRQQIVGLRLANQGYGSEHGEGDEEGMQSPEVEEEAEALDKSPRLHRKSLIGSTVPTIDMAGPLSPALERPKGEVDAKGEGFE